MERVQRVGVLMHGAATDPAPQSPGYDKVINPRNVLRP
jgi:hypothetical protein